MIEYYFANYIRTDDIGRYYKRGMRYDINGHRVVNHLSDIGVSDRFDIASPKHKLISRLISTINSFVPAEMTQVAGESTYSFSCSVEDGDIVLDIPTSNSDYIVKYGKEKKLITQINGGRFKRVILAEDNKVNIFDLENNKFIHVTSKTHSTIIDIIVDEDNIIEENQIRMKAYKGYQYDYDEFGNVDQVTKDAIIVSTKEISEKDGRTLIKRTYPLVGTFFPMVILDDNMDKDYIVETQELLEDGNLVAFSIAIIKKDAT